MPSDLHQSVWLAYRRPGAGDKSGSAVTSFQAAVDTVLRSSPGVDAPSACKEAVRMVMMSPVGRRRPRAGTTILRFPTLAAQAWTRVAPRVRR
jgi:hypothetical protein